VASTISGSAEEEERAHNSRRGRGSEAKGSHWCEEEERRSRQSRKGGEEREERRLEGKERKRGEEEGRSGEGRESLQGSRRAGRAKGGEGAGWRRSGKEERECCSTCCRGERARSRGGGAIDFGGTRKGGGRLQEGRERASERARGEGSNWSTARAE